MLLHSPEAVMALSEREQRLLEEMERNLYNNEADVVTTLGVRRVPNYRAIAIGAIIAVLGLVTMVVGVSLDVTILGIVGFAVLFTGVMVAVATPGKPVEKSTQSGKTSSSSPSTGSFMDQLNERWERRSNGDPR
jgi:hypothetical protein